GKPPVFSPHIGGFTPFFSAVTTRATRLPSDCFWPMTRTAAPGLRRLRSPGAKVTIGVRASTLIVAEPPLYSRVSVRLFFLCTTPATVALVMVLFGVRSQG